MKLVGTMRKMSFFRQLCCCYFSKPASDRRLYRTAVEFEFKSVVELGISSIERSCRLLELAHRYCDEPINYTGIDLFESDVSGTNRIGLKVAHVELKKTGAKVKLMPGDPFSCLSRSANLLSGTDLLIIGQNVDEESMSRSWFYIPRMIHEDSLVMIESREGDELRWEQADYGEMMRRAEQTVQISTPAARRAA